MQDFLRRWTSLRGMVLAIVLGTLAAVAAGVPAQAQDILSALPAEARARLVEPAELSAAYAARGGAPVRVIVGFARPDLPAGVQAGSGLFDARLAEAIASVQQEILGRTLSGAAAQAAPELGLRRMTHLPMMALNADPALLGRLAQDPAVLRIHLDRAVPPLLTGSLPLIGMPAAYAAGGTGQGQVVAVLDTGARLSHEFLASRIVAGACFNTNDPFGTGATSRCPGGATSATTLASANDCTASTLDGCGHGTHVAGIAAGFVANPAAGNPAHGVARDGRLIVVNVFSQFPDTACGPYLPPGYTGCLLAFVSDLIAALNHIYSLRNSYQIAAVNMSLGRGQFFSACPYEPEREAIQLLRSVGIAVIAAAGNDGLDTAISSPACIPEAIAVGSTTLSDARSSFSNWGPLVDIAAPGSSIRSSYINGASDTSYANLSGTSMAAPHVAGAFAAIRSAQPAATIDEILTALQQTGSGVTAAGTTVPRINVDLALAALAATTPTTTMLSGPAASTVGSPVTFAAQVSSAGGTPTGMVTFARNGASFATATLGPTGQASVTTYALPVGAGTITATYTGGGDFAPSTSAGLTHTVSAPAVPVNDNFADRIVIPAPGAYAGRNVGGTREAGEPNHLATVAGGASIWWSLTPSTSGTVTLDTCGSDFDTILAVYTGTNLTALSQVASNDDSCGLRSRVSFAGTGGTTYQIAVASWGVATGNVLLQADFPHTPAVATTTSLSGPTVGVVGQNLTFNAAVSAGTGMPTGTVSFRRNGAEFATAMLNGAGQASVTTAGIPEGTHAITAHYLGAPGFQPSASAALNLQINPLPADPVEFLGGGAVFGFNATCAANGWPATVQPVRLRYGPSETNGLPSQVAILWPSGSEHLQVWQPLAPSSSSFQGLGRQMWSFFVLNPNRPFVRPLQRRITRPEGGTDIATAEEVMLRLRVSNFGGIVGCGATVAGVLRRVGG